MNLKSLQFGRQTCVDGKGATDEEKAEGNIGIWQEHEWGGNIDEPSQKEMEPEAVRRKHC